MDLRKALLSASGDDRRKITDEIEREAFASVPYVPLGQIKQPTVYRTSLSGILATGIPVFWNIQKA
jgi:peptide/nickel transport system substrate-binding protein